MSGFKVVRGSLLLREWREADAEALAQVITENIEHLRPFLPWVTFEPMELPARRALIARWVTEADHGGDLLVGLFNEGAIVGGCGLHTRIGSGGLEIGYWVHKNHLRLGIATLAARALTDVGFARPEIDRIEIHHDVANAASGGVPKVLGFTLIGDEPRERRAPADTGVHRIWRVTRAEWMAIRP
jgi:RimJ/RimL family protein N-acetyltransferase